MRGEIAFRILGRSFRARVVTPELAGWLEKYWHFPEHRLPPHPYRIELRRVPGAGVAPAVREPADAGALPPATDLGWRRRGRAWEPGGRGEGPGLRAWHRPGGSRIVVRGMDGHGPRDPAYLPLFQALGHALWGSGLIPLHAAVVQRDGETTALLGRSGAGKSTTLLHAVRAGWRPLAEDTAWLEPTSLCLYGWDRALHLWPETRERFAPELARAGWTPDARGKLALPFERLGVAGARTGRLARIALLQQDPSRPSAWEPLAPRDAVRALWEAVGVPLEARDHPLLARFISGIVTRVRLARLWLGSTPLPL